MRNMQLISRRLSALRVGVSALPVRLLIWSLTLVQRFVNSQAFRWALRMVLRPIIRVWFYWFAARAIFGSLPKWLSANPQTAPFALKLEEARNAPIQTDTVSDTGRKLMQALTWGVASVAIIVLTQTITSQPQNVTTARSLACGCFALVVPWLGVLGYMVTSDMDPKQPPPTVHQTLILHSAIYVGLLVFCFGFASLLWSYSPSIAGLFVLSTIVVVRRFLSFAKKRAATAPPPVSIIVRLP
jgi:hypothetical protein